MIQNAAEFNFLIDDTKQKIVMLQSSVSSKHMQPSKLFNSLRSDPSNASNVEAVSLSRIEQTQSQHLRLTEKIKQLIFQQEHYFNDISKKHQYITIKINKLEVDGSPNHVRS